MKKCFIYIITFIILIFVCNYSIDYTVGKQLEKQSPYYLAFTSIGANSLEFHIDCWAKIKTISSENELKSYLQNILQTLNLPDELDNYRFHKNRNSVILQYEISSPDQKYIFLLESDEKTNETYFIINITAQDEALIKNIPAKLNKIIGISWTYYYLYTASLSAPLDIKGCQEMMKVIEKNLAIRDMEIFADGDTCSFTGYSPLLSNYSQDIKVNDKAVNIQVAFQLDEELKKTNIIFGSPLILGEY